MYITLSFFNELEGVYMQYERLSDFSGKGSYLLFSFPMYTKIKIDMNIDTSYDAEFIDYNDGAPNVLHHINFLENKDVRFLKKLVQEEKNFFHYCPFCKRELPIIHKGLELDNKLSSSLLTTYSYMNSMSEEFEIYEEDAIKDAAKRYEELIKQIFGDNGLLQMNLECTSKDKHKFYVIFQLIDNHYIMKTGQYPSILDFDDSLKEYKKVLKDKEITKELTNAEILKTHNMGVGAFLYLRRIFEKLILEQFTQANHAGALEEKEFMKAKTKEKVVMLSEKGYISKYMADINPYIYDILSQGVHQLDNRECNMYYDTLREAILLILEEKVEIDRKEKVKKKTKNELNKIHSNLPQ